MGTPTEYVCDYWSGWVCLPRWVKSKSSRVPVPLPEDPYKGIRQAYLDGTTTESEPFEDPIDTETPDSPLAIVPPILVPILCRTACIAVHVPHMMSPGLSASMAEVAVMSESALRKSFWSSYECSPSVSPPDLPLRKSYRGTSELVEGSEENDDEEDEEIDESMDSDSVSEDAEDEGPTAEDEDPAAENEVLTAGVEGPSMDDEDYDLDDETHGRDDESHGIDDEGHSVKSDGLGLENEEAVPGGQRQAAPVMGTTVSAPLGLGYGALRCRELVLEEGDVYITFEVGQGFRSTPESERPERVSAFRQPTLTKWTDLEDGMIYIDIPNYPPPAPPVQTPPLPEWTSATPATVETKGFLTELGDQVKMHEGLIHDHVVQLEELSPALFERYNMDIGELFTRLVAVREEIFSQRYRFRSLEYEQERVVVTFRAIWRPVLALEAWAGQTDA
ncbi:hypothetical protein Tco_1116481 [Tanacetum coccineum]